MVNFLVRRIVYGVLTAIVISAISFLVITLPPGDFATTYVQTLLGGEFHQFQQRHVDSALEDQIRSDLGLDQPLVIQYSKWAWHILTLDFGTSIFHKAKITEVVGQRLVNTVLLALGTILFTWAIALPIGIYSAVRQYTLGDYFFTFLGFIGMSIPSFLLALILLYWSGKYFGINVTGLFSPEYAVQSEWTGGKIIDLLQHIWVPIVVLGITGTAGMIRVMRGNLLDELKKPYVTTGKAKGLRPFKLMMKYPVRLAINPFISSIGAIFPQLISGGAIVAMVLSLPTVGPLLLDALMIEDIYLAGSMLMVLSLLGILGTLVSDLLLMWLDPRIRMEGGIR